MATLRRMVTTLIPQKFDMRIGDKVCAHVAQHFNPFVLKLDVDLSKNEGNILDPRLALAAVILLSAIEGRQN